MRHLSRLSFGLAVAVALLLAQPAQAQRDNSEPRASPNARVSQTIGTTEVDLHYSRPGVRDREIFGDLVPYGEAWRAGANEPTTITVSDAVQIEGQTLEAGTYNIFMRPSQEGEWDVIFTEPVRWGTMFDQAAPVLEVSVSPEQGPEKEWLAYHFEDLTESSADLVMHWDTAVVPITISTPE